MRSAQIIAFPQRAVQSASSDEARMDGMREVGAAIRENAARRGRLIQIGAFATALSLAQHIERLADLAASHPEAAELRANALRTLGRMEAAHG